MSEPEFTVDKEGFLRNLEDWSREVAAELARREGIELTDEHWCVIDTVRAYYDTFRLSPITRILVKIVREAHGEKLGSSIRLMQLFTPKPAKIANKIAGLPKPPNCD